jgi:hypothetical protein
MDRLMFWCAFIASAGLFFMFLHAASLSRDASREMVRADACEQRAKAAEHDRAVDKMRVECREVAQMAASLVARWPNSDSATTEAAWVVSNEKCLERKTTEGF